MSSVTLAADKQQATDWLRRGQAFEAGGDPGTLAQALVCYDQVIALLRTLPPADTARELAIAHMNRGNVLRQLERREDAVAAYDDAIAGLQSLTDAGDHAARNSLGAAWMNRGHALQLSASSAALAEALRSHDRAITLLQALPLGEHPAYRANLAGAWLNRAQVLVATPAPDFAAARSALASALALTHSSERDHPLVAEIALKARHALCAVLTHQAPDAGSIAQTGDELDAALELARHWETRGVRAFRPVAHSLYRFGAQFYLAHQPQFLAEFLLESLDPARAAGAIPGSAELHAIASEALARAQSDNYNRRLAMPTGHEAVRLQEVAEGLHTAEARRQTLQQAHP